MLYSVTEMEATTDLLPFDLLNIALLHTWVVDRVEQASVHEAFAERTYNELVTARINAADVTVTSSERETAEGAPVFSLTKNVKMIFAALVIEEFLDTHATQMTMHGLQTLIGHMNEHDVCVLFRNNHFLTVTKHEV